MLIAKKGDRRRLGPANRVLPSVVSHYIQIKILSYTGLLMSPTPPGILRFSQGGSIYPSELRELSLNKFFPLIPVTGMHSRTFHTQSYFAQSNINTI